MNTQPNAPQNPMLILNGDLIHDCNKEFLKILGYKNKKEIIGKKQLILSPTYQYYDKKSVNFTQHINKFSWVFKRRDGGNLAATVTLTKNKKGCIIADVIPFYDKNLELKTEVINWIENIRNNNDALSYCKLKNFIDLVFGY